MQTTISSDISAKKRLLGQVTRRYKKIMNEGLDNLPRHRSSSSSSSTSNPQSRRAKKPNSSLTTDNISAYQERDAILASRNIELDQKLYALGKENPAALIYLKDKLHQTTNKRTRDQKARRSAEPITFTQSIITENPGPTRRSLGNESHREGDNDVKIDKRIKSQLQKLKEPSHLDMISEASKERLRDLRGRNQIQKKNKSWTPFCLKLLFGNLLLIFGLFWWSKPGEVSLQEHKNNLIGLGNKKLDERGVVNEIGKMNNLDLEFERLNQELEQLIESSKKTTSERFVQTALFSCIGVLLLQIGVWFVYMIWTS